MTGKGAVPCNDALNAGLFGRYDRIANRLIEESDLLLVVGAASSARSPPSASPFPRKASA
jgi:thiamine pyrophosphate-dependent acetolactate synthase large subunit-like protein